MHSGRRFADQAHASGPGTRVSLIICYCQLALPPVGVGFGREAASMTFCSELIINARTVVQRMQDGRSQKAGAGEVGDRGTPCIVTCIMTLFSSERTVPWEGTEMALLLGITPWSMRISRLEHSKNPNAMPPLRLEGIFSPFRYRMCSHQWRCVVWAHLWSTVNMAPDRPWARQQRTVPIKKWIGLQHEITHFIQFRIG